MAIQSYVGANLVPGTHTFRAQLDRVNSLSNDLASVVVTSAANSTGGLTTGNVAVNGVFSSNTLTAIAGIRGGTVATPANLTILSNTVTSANVFLNGATSFVNGNIVVNSSGIFSTTVNVLGGSNTFINAAILTITSNTTVNGTTTLNGAVVVNNALTINGNTSLGTVIVNVITGGITNVNSNTVNVRSNTTFSNTVSFTKDLNLPASSFINANGDLVLSGNAQVNNLVVLNGFGGVINAIASDSLALNGQNSSFYTNASNITTGTIGNSRLPNTISGKNITSSIFAAYGESVYANTNVNANLVLDLSAFNIFNLTLTANNVVLTMHNPYTSGNATSATLIINQDGTGTRLATIGGRNAANSAAGTIRYPFGSTPTLSTGANKADILQFVTYDGGSNYFGSLSLANT